MTSSTIKNSPLSHKVFPARWEDFLKILTDRLSKASPAMLNVRCLSESTLSHLFESIRSELNLPSTFPSGNKIRDLLISMGLALRVPIEVSSGIKPSNKFILFGIHGHQEISVDPRELLQAYHPSGVICYFSALSYLGLTTQIATHHHVALLSTKRIKPTTRHNERVLPSIKAIRSLRSKLGTPIFSYQGIPYFSTKRTKHSVPGITTRILSPLAKYRMTTKEQTLLDSLQYPYHCGGPETVFEAWEMLIKEINEDLLLDYIKRINIAPITRRIGAIFELYNYKYSKKFEIHLNNSRRRFVEKEEFKTISLLRGIDYSRINRHWNVTIP